MTAGTITRHPSPAARVGRRPCRGPRLLDPAHVAQLTGTRHRLAAPDRDDAESVEAGVWRVRFEEILRAHPELAAPLHDLFVATASRLADAYRVA